MKKIIIVALLVLASLNSYGTETTTIPVPRTFKNLTGTIPLSYLDEDFTALSAATITTPERLVGGIDSQRYSTLVEAATAASTTRTLFITKQYTVSSSMTFSCPVRIVKGGRLTIDPLQTVTFSGPFSASTETVFSCTTSTCVSFTSGAIKEAFTEWWGAKGDNSTDSYIAIMSALSSNAKVITLLTGTYLSSNAAAISIPAGVTFQGMGPSSYLKRNSSTAGHFVVTSGEYAVVKDMSIDGNGAIVPGSYPVGGSTVELNADHTSIIGCTLYKNRFATIGAQDHSYLDILGNTIVSAEDGAIEVVSATVPVHHIRIIGNPVLNVGTFGISVDSFPNVTPDLESSIIISDNPILVDNTGAIPGFTGRAIDIQNAKGVIASRNLIQLDAANALGIRVYTTADESIISDNIIRFTANATDAIGIQIAYGNSGTRTENNRVFGNVISLITTTPATANLGYGIYVDDHSAFLYSNTIKNMNIGMQIVPVDNTALITYTLQSNRITGCNYGVNMAGTRTSATPATLNNNFVDSSVTGDWVIGAAYKIHSENQNFNTATSTIYGTLIDGLVADVGDADYTYDSGQTPKTIIWTSAITGNKTLTLHTTGAQQGEKVRMVKANTSSFTVTVPGLKSLPSGTTGWADFIYSGGGWILTGSGSPL